MKRSLARIAAVLLCSLTVLGAPFPAAALDLGDLLKKGALIVGGGAAVTANIIAFNNNASIYHNTHTICNCTCIKNYSVFLIFSFK